MKKVSELATLFLLLATTSVAQYTLDTPDGKKVRLNKDGTWAYVISSEQKTKESSIPSNSTARYFSKFNKYAICYNPDQWFYDTTKKSNGFTWDATFYSKDLAIFGYWMDSRLSSPIDQLEKMVKDQWSDQGEVKSFSSFKDTINELPLVGYDLLLEYGGVTYQYRGYVYSTPKGSFQFTVGTQKEVFEEDERKIDELFRGLIKL